MSRIKPHLRRLIGLCLLAAAFGLVEVVAIAAADEGQRKKVEPPTLLWKSYPLEQRPSTTQQSDVPLRKQSIPGRASAHEDEFLIPVLVGGLILLLIATALMRKRRSIPILPGKTRRTPDRGPALRPAQPASVKGPRWRRRHLREVIPEVVGEPRARTPQPPASESAPALLETLQLKSPRAPESEPGPEITATRSEEGHPGRTWTAEPSEPEAAKQREVRETGHRPVPEREAEAGESLEHQLELELWTRIADVKLVPVPGPNPPTHEEFPPP